MRLIERYLFRQLLGPTLLATLALVALALLARSLSEFDVLIEQRQSATVFLKIIALALPQLLSMILPIALFVATLVALNRLHTEQEIVVCFAGGMSRWRVISPAMRLAVFATLLSLAMSLWAAPWSSRAIRETFFDIKSDLASTLVRPGEFTEPGPGLTVYAQAIDRDQIIHNLFIHQEKPNGGAVTYTAREGVIAERKGLPVLVLRKGSNQEFSSAGVLQYLSWDEYTFDLSSLFQSDELLHYKIGDRYPHELFFPDLTQEWEQQNRVKLLSEGHWRLASPLYNLAMMTMAVAAVLGGPFSRMGYGRRIAIIGAAAATIQILGFGVKAACDNDVWLNPLQYIVPLSACWWGLGQIFRQKVSRYIAIGHHDDALQPMGAPMIGVGMIERYVLKKTLSSLAAALAVVSVLVMLIAFVDISKNVGTRAEVGFAQLLFLTVLQAPATILVLTPFIFLFGTLGAFVGLNRRSELIAMRAAGVSAWRFIMPAAVAAFVMGVLTLTLLNPLTSAMSAQFETSRNAVMENYLKSAPKGLWLRQGDEKTQVVIRARARDQVGGSVRLRGVSLFEYAVQPNGTLQFARRIEADEARLEPGFWQLSGVRVATPGAGAIRSEAYTMPSNLDDRTASERFNNPQAIAVWRLPETIKRTEAAGFSSIPFRLRLQQLLATPLLFAAMSVLAAAFSLRLMRLGGLAGLAGAGVTLGFGFFFFNELCGALGKADVLTPAMAAWTPPIVALLAGLTLLCYTEDG